MLKSTFGRYVSSITNIKSKEQYNKLVDIVNQICTKVLLSDEEIEVLNKLLNEIAIAHGYVNTEEE